MGDTFADCALVLGGQAITTLGVCRNLGVSNVNVFCVNDYLNEAAFSRFCKSFFVVPNIENSFNVLDLFLRKFRKPKSRTVIFPASDLFCLALAKIGDSLKDDYVYLPSKESVETLVNKKCFSNSLNGTDIPRPKTILLDNPVKSEDIAEKLDFPVLIKPAITQEFAKFNVKSFVAQNKSELNNYIEAVTKDNISVVIQEIICGPDTNLFGIAGYIGKDHHVKGIFAYKRIRGWPLDFGCNSMIESIPIQFVAESKDYVLDYLKNIRYCGLFEAEFKTDERDGIPKILEINARSWWQNHFPTACGINLVLMSFLDAIGKKVEYKDIYKIGLKWVHSFNDARAAMTLFQRGQLSFSNWISSYNGVNDYSYFCANDVVPYLCNPFFVGPVYTRELLRKLDKFGRSISCNTV